MKDFIRDHLGEAVMVDMIARKVNLSAAYCGELFVKCEGMTIHEFINNLRINHAKDLLSARTDMPLTAGISIRESYAAPETPSSAAAPIQITLNQTLTNRDLTARQVCFMI